MEGTTDTMDTTNVNDSEYYIFTTGNMCRLFFYTPIIFCISVIGSVIYDYVTYNFFDHHMYVTYDDKKNNNPKKSE